MKDDDAQKRIRHLAKLANLTLTEEEVLLFSRELPALLSQMEGVKRAKPASGKPLALPTSGAEDHPEASLPLERLLILAGATREGFILGPPVDGR
ncbi:aspartyl/glutamyl-tRNA amidotransferase subunit C [bacterium]|nr:aspartyl/glutamyl-tRNA amidotransferase subunit C [bacterium]